MQEFSIMVDGSKNRIVGITLHTDELDHTENELIEKDKEPRKIHHVNVYIDPSEAKWIANILLSMVADV